MNKKMISAVFVSAFIAVSCNKNDNPTPEPQQEVGKNLIATTVKNPDGQSGASYIQLAHFTEQTLSNNNARQVGFATPISVEGKDFFVFPSYGQGGGHQLMKFSLEQGLTNTTTLDIIPNAGAYNLTFISPQKAYLPLYNLGIVWIINPTTMKKIGEIDLKSYAHGDSSPEPAQGILHNGKYYLPLNQIDGEYMPYADYQQCDVLIINPTTDQVEKVISETATGLTFPTRPFLKDMIFANEQGDLYIACAGYFGYVPNMTKNGFICIPNGKNEFDPSKSWDISQTTIQGTSYKPASVYNCKYIGGGKLVAFVCIAELNGTNPFTSRSAMAVLIDLNGKTIQQINGIPLTDGHSVVISSYKNLIVFGAYGSDKVGLFTYNPANNEVKHVITTTGNPSFFHSFE